MRRVIFGAMLLLGLVLSAVAAAQGGDGSLRGTVLDAQGGAIPGRAPIVYTIPRTF